MVGLLRERYRVSEVRFSLITLSWRGVWSAESANDLLTLGVSKEEGVESDLNTGNNMRHITSSIKALQVEAEIDG